MGPAPVLQLLQNYVGSIVAERYELVRLLGNGSSASVYFAKDAKLPMPCAVKLTHPDVDPEGKIVARFQREYDLASVLIHPNIIRAFDIGEVGDGVWYIAMEYIEGDTLYQRLESGGRKGLPLADVFKLGYQLLLGLEAAHTRSVVHRDLKPGNLLVSKQGVLTILDFGVAKPLLTTEKLSARGDGFGTLPYMTPEQLTGGEVGCAADIYSVGVLLFELLCGRVPFETLDSNVLIWHKLYSSFPDIRKSRPDCPGWLARLIESCANREASLRPPTAKQVLGEFRRDLPRSLRDEIHQLLNIC